MVDTESKKRSQLNCQFVMENIVNRYINSPYDENIIKYKQNDKNIQNDLVTLVDALTDRYVSKDEMKTIDSYRFNELRNINTLIRDYHLFCSPLISQTPVDHYNILKEIYEETGDFISDTKKDSQQDFQYLDNYIKEMNEQKSYIRRYNYKYKIIDEIDKKLQEPNISNIQKIYFNYVSDKIYPGISEYSIIKEKISDI